MNDLRITGIQSDLKWEDPQASRAHLDSHFNTIKEETDLILLPEMFTTGFSMQPKKVAEHFDAVKMETLNWMRAWAEKKNAVVAGSVSVEEDGSYYNRLLWVRPDGSFSQYDKRHLFMMTGEHQQYSAGTKKLVEDVKGWKICSLICYDLRFPVWSRNTLVNKLPEYDVLIYVANWPEVRNEPWKKLLLARAIENQCYTAGINRIGMDGTGSNHTGESSFINPRGEYLHQFQSGKEEVRTHSFSWKELSDFRAKFPVLEDADHFSIS